MSNFLVCIMLLAIVRATNQEFAGYDSLVTICAIAFFLDVFRLTYHLYWKE